MNFGWEFLSLCYGVVAGLLYTFVYWIEVVLGLPTGENEPDSIDESHTNLKNLVQRIIEEVFKIPEFFDQSGVPSEPQRINLPQFDPKRYEELLATAVLNKIVESYNYERRFENSSGIHSGSDPESNANTVFSKALLETESTCSSNEPRSDSSTSNRLTDQPMSLTITNFVQNLSDHSNHSAIESPLSSPHSVGSNEEAYLSDYIQKHKVPLPHIDPNSIDSDCIDDECQSISSNDTEGKWQENWLFKKRKLKNEGATAIGMLVPSPTVEVKALIGDKTTDEVSDLSEVDSDLDDGDDGTVNGRVSADLPHALVESKTIIGGKNEVKSFDEARNINELLQPDSLVSVQSINNQSPVIMEAKNELILINAGAALQESVDSNDKNRSSDGQTNESNRAGVAEPTEQIRDSTSVQRALSEQHIEQPPVPTPRRKSKSLDASKRVASIEAPNPDANTPLTKNETIISQLIAEENIKNILFKEQPKPTSLEDELLDSSINDIYQSIDETGSNIDYQSLVIDYGNDENQPLIASEESKAAEQSVDSLKEATTSSESISVTANVSETNEQTANKKEDKSKKSLIIPVIIENDTVPVVIADSEEQSVKPRKVLKSQDSLEIPKEIHDKYEPVKYVESLDRDTSGKISPTLDVNFQRTTHSDVQKSADITTAEIESFVFVTDEERDALKFEEARAIFQQIEQQATDQIQSKVECDNSNDVTSELISFVTTKSKDFDESSATIVATSANAFVSMKSLKTAEYPTDTSAVKTLETATDTNKIETFTTNLDLTPPINTVELNEFGDLPGSIAEREHLKWKNAQDIPNNPYSAEALQRRLSQTKNASKIIDISHLATKIDATSAKAEIDDGQPLRMVLGAGEPDHARYGRDYYINDAKYASGTRKKLTSTQQYSSTDEDNLPSKPATPDADSIFTAKLVHVASDHDSINLSHCSDSSSKVKLSSLSNTSCSLSPQSDSIVLSDDSDSTRVYDLQRKEKIYLRTDIIRTSRHPIGAAATVTPPSTPIDGDVNLNKNLDQFLAIKQLNQLKRTEDEANGGGGSEERNSVSSQSRSLQSAFTSSVLSADTVKFFTPKLRPVFNEKVKMDQVAAVPAHEKETNDISVTKDEVEKSATSDLISSPPAVVAEKDDSIVQAVDVVATTNGTATPTDAKLENGTATPTDAKVEPEIATAAAPVEKVNEPEVVPTPVAVEVVEEVVPTATPVEPVVEQEVAPPPKPVEVIAEEEAVQAPPPVDTKVEVIATTESEDVIVPTEVVVTPTPVKEVVEEAVVATPAPVEAVVQEDVPPPSVEEVVAKEVSAPEAKVVEKNGFSTLEPEKVVAVKEDVITGPMPVTPAKSVIEEDVVSALPSVRALAKNFLVSNATEAVPQPQRTRNSWQVNKEKNGTTPSPDSFVPVFQPGYHPVAPGHSITARSLSTKFRQELRHSTSDNGSNGTDNIEIIERQRDHSPNRPPSPELLKGVFKKNISFFQNLEK